MTGIGQQLRRALSMPFPVLTRKLAQRGRALGQRLVTSPDTAWQLDSISPDVLESVRRNCATRFFLHPADRMALIEALTSREPETVARILHEANEVRAHRFDLLGSGPTELGGQIDWHRDFKSGLRWELRHHSALDILDLSRPSDVKVVWELSRCHHWVRLGQAYWLTGNSDYAEEFLAQWESWIQDNPPGFGANWTCAMEVAIRAVNWLWVYSFFMDVPAFHSERQRRFVAALADHGRFILRNLEVGPLPGNHYLTDGVGLLTLGTVLPELKGSDHWLKRGWQILWEQLDRQVTPDGVDYEHAIGYHGYVLQCMLFALSLCRRNDRTVSPHALQRIERMLEFTLAYTRPDGSFPTIGDNDDGSLMDLGPSFAQDHRSLLATGAVLFGRGDLKAVSKKFGASNLWWLGIPGLEAYEALHERAVESRSLAFPHGGFFVQRGQDRHLTVSGLGLGPASHMHHDLLSFECWADGTLYVCDPGSYTYTASPEWRNRFRSTAFHNTVMVNGQEQTRLLDDPSLFPLRRDPSTRFLLRRWETGDQYDILDAEHTGYARLPQPVTHRRQIWFDGRNGLWAVRDILAGTGEHRVTGFLHLAPVQVTTESQDPWIISAGNHERKLVIAWVQHPTLFVSVADGWLSPRYGVKQRAPVVSYEASGSLPIQFTFVLLPQQHSAPLDVAAVLRWAAELQ